MVLNLARSFQTSHAGSFRTAVYCAYPLRNYSRPYKQTSQKIREIIQRPSHLSRVANTESISLHPTSSDQASLGRLSKSSFRNVTSYSEGIVAGGGVEMTPNEQMNILNKDDILGIGESESGTPPRPRDRSNAFSHTPQTSRISIEPTTGRPLILSDSTKILGEECETEQLPTSEKNASEME